MGPNVLGAITSPYIQIAQQLTRVLEKQVSEEEAVRLMRAYRSRNARRIRVAMSKYAAKWKTLNPKVKADILAMLTQAQQGAVAGFETLNDGGPLATSVIAQLPVQGACVILPSSGVANLDETFAPLDAGPSLLLTTPGNTYAMNQLAAGHYSSLFATSATGSSSRHLHHFGFRRQRCGSFCRHHHSCQHSGHLQQRSTGCG
jgi:hypothetical protein